MSYQDVVARRSFLLAALVLLLGCAMGDSRAEDPAPPTKPEPSVEAARKLFDRGDYLESAKLYSQVTAADPSNGLAWLDLGIALHLAGRMEQAYEVHKKAAVFPDYAPPALFNAACAAARLGRTDEAFEHLERAQEAGFLGLEEIRSDSDLASLHEDRRFKILRGWRYESLPLPGISPIEFVTIEPEGHDPEDRRPVLIALPPGEQGRADVEFGLRTYWGAQAARRGWVVVSPVAPPEGWLSPEGTRRIGALLVLLEQRYRLEGGRFHLAGASTGGMSAFHLAVELPERFRSLTVVPGVPSAGDGEKLTRLTRVQVKLFVGDEDESWTRGSRQLEEILDHLGVPTTLTVVPGEGHVLRSLFYGKLIDALADVRGVTSP